MGIPFGLLTVILVIVSGKSIYTLYALGLIGALLFLAWLLLIALYRGRYEVEFVLDDKGILSRTQAEQTKKNKMVNAMTVSLGIFSRQPTIVGTGILAQSRQNQFLKWSRIRKVKYNPQQRTILIRSGWTENIALFCTEENYLFIEQVVMIQTKHLKGGGLLWKIQHRRKEG